MIVRCSSSVFFSRAKQSVSLAIGIEDESLLGTPWYKHMERLYVMPRIPIPALAGCILINQDIQNVCVMHPLLGPRSPLLRRHNLLDQHASRLSHGLHLPLYIPSVALLTTYQSALLIFR